ncbi:MAG: hypothetical protein ACK55Z_24790, partial [bacterium]
MSKALARGSGVATGVRRCRRGGQRRSGPGPEASGETSAVIADQADRPATERGLGSKRFPRSARPAPLVVQQDGGLARSAGSAGMAGPAGSAQPTALA